MHFYGQQTKMQSRKLLCFYVSTFLLVNIPLSLSLGCRDEETGDLDWYVNYKLPKIDNGFPRSSLSDGKAYAYISSSKPGNWKLSPKNITSEESMLSKTLQPLFDMNAEASYIFYNDEPPDGYNGTANGHLKGVVAFDDTAGFWLVHSIPKFSEINKYKYPDNALDYGQSILCVTLNVSSLNEICRQLLYAKPKIYATQVSDRVLPLLDDIARTIFSDKPAFNKKSPFKRVSVLKSVKKEIFVTFAKGGKFKDDVYSSMIAPALKSSLSTETWRRGSGTYLPPSCGSNYTVTDITSIRMKAKLGNGNQDLVFSSKDDHSKWAVSSDPSQNWICVGDMNRMLSQERRGGGALCFQSKKIAKAYQSLIASSDHCSDQ